MDAARETKLEPGEQGEVPLDPKAVARAAKLRYVTDKGPGYRRVHQGASFAYLEPDGSPVSDEETLARIRKLAIPPAYTDVWICRKPNGHLQAVGRDARGRKQYRYHPRWRVVRDEAKYGKMLLFGRVLPAIRREVEKDLALPGLPRRRCSRRSCACWKRPSCASAMRNMPRPITASA